MTSPPQQIEVICPNCAKRYKDWYRPSINMSLGEEFDEQYLDEATSSTCPHCRHKVSHGVLIVRKDGVWQIGRDPSVADDEEVDLEALEREFHQAMIDVYRRAKKECNYPAMYFLRMVTESGGLEAARTLLHKQQPSEGFTELYMHGRLDLSVEYHVLMSRFAPLFTDEERAIARRWLEQHKFTDWPL
jgi:hypothetical protein